MEPLGPALPLPRRHFLAAAAAAALLPSKLAGAPGESLRILLDRAAAAPDPATRLNLLRAAPPPADRVDAAILQSIVRGIEREEALRRFWPLGKEDGSSPYVLSQRHGAYLELARPGPGLAVRLVRETERLRTAAAAGIVPPAVLLDRVIEAQSSAPASLPTDVAKALERQRSALEGLRPRAPRLPGVSNLPGGRRYFELRLRSTTGSEITLAVLDRRVRAETRLLLTRADRLLEGLGLSRGSVGARLRTLKARPEHLYADDSSGRSRAVADMNRALERLRPRLGAWFDPPLAGEASVLRMSPADELAKRRGYRETAGGGAYYPDLAQVRDRPAWSLTTVAYHETIPGHLLQLARQAQADPHPLQVRYAAGYSEGWAIYAESLADRMGLLSPVEQLGYLQSVLFRLARVTADIGVNWHGWERARALDYLEETVGFELFFPFEVEVDRYAAEPGGFAGDALVALELMRLGARRRLDADLRAFHEGVLRRGPLPVEALAALV